MKSSPHWLELEKAQLIVKTQCSQKKKDTNLKKKKETSNMEADFVLPLNK